jgi:hypothetical protein
MTPRPSHLRRSGTFAPVASAAFVLAVVLAAPGCGLFSTAQPEPPTTGNPIPPPNFVLPESTLATLVRSVENRLTEDYKLCFTDSLGNEEPGFYASFDQSDLADWLQENPHPGIWTLEREAQFFPRFLAFNPNAFYTMVVDTLRPDFDIDPSTRVLNRTYRVHAAGSPVAAGAAILTFRRVGLSGEWKIGFWEDLRDTAGVRTWGVARHNGQ